MNPYFLSTTYQSRQRSATDAMSAPILLLHTSCKKDGEEVGANANEPLPPFSFDSGVPQNDYSMSEQYFLTKQPIQCDLLILPEFQNSPSTKVAQHSSSSPSMPETLHVSHLSINPCGKSNVVVLDNVTWNKNYDDNSENTIAPSGIGSLLVSLTSCSVAYYQRSKSKENDVMKTYDLPIEPNPSTFVVFFEEDKESPQGGTKDTQPADLSVEFDFGKASNLVEELFNVGTLKMHTKVFSNESTTPATSSFTERRNCAEESNLAKEHETRFDHAGHDYSSFAFDDAQERGFVSYIMELEERKLLLQQLHLRMEQDARAHDAALQALGCISLFLFGLLIWAIYQYYRSNVKSEAQAKEIREFMKKTRRVFQDEAEGMQPSLLDKIFQLDETKQKEPDEVNERQSQMSDPNNEIPHSPNPPFQIDFALPNHRKPKGDHFHSVATPRTPDNNDTRIDVAEWGIKSSTEIPYTYAKFAKEWMERKTIRRSNRKKRPSLRPIHLPAEYDQKMDNCRDLNHGIVGPPKLMSVVHSKAKGKIFGQRVVARSELSSTEDSGAPSLSTGSKLSSDRTPNLCYTPSSEDDSFINDYWF